MKYKKLVKLVLSALMIVLIGGVIFKYSYTNSTEMQVQGLNKDIVNEVDVYGMHVGYLTLDDLDKSAELIVLASPVADFKDRNHVVKYTNNKKVIGDFYTITDLKITKVIKSPDDFSLNKAKTIQIIEPIGMIETSKGLSKYLINGYREMKKNSKYIVFLKKNTQGTYYGVINADKGKYNIDNTDTEDNGKAVTGNESKEYLESIQQKIKDKIKWKEKVVEKYGNYLK